MEVLEVGGRSDGEFEVGLGGEGGGVGVEVGVEGGEEGDEVGGFGLGGGVFLVYV